MDSVLDHSALVRALHDAPLRLVLAATGGGSGAIAELLQVPGASRTVLEAIVPYSAAALTDWLHARPELSCHERTARAMAMVAFQRALSLAAREEPTDSSSGASTDLPSPADSVSLLSPLAGEGPGVRGSIAPRLPHLAGIGCTASLASDRPKRGAHRLHVAVQTAAATCVHSLELSKGARPRREEEDVATALVLNAAAEAAGLAARLELPLLAGERVETDSFAAPPAWRELLLGDARIVRYRPATSVEKETEAAPTATRAVFPGAFNPLHVGHRRMAEVAAELLGTRVDFEISIANVDKPPLDYLEMARRGRQFEASQPLWFTRAATFREKSRLFPAATFVVGADTIVRLPDPKYYGGDPDECQAALEEIAGHGCRFLVFGRAKEGRFDTLDDLALPPALLGICRGVPAERFREDISSTELRREATGA